MKSNQSELSQKALNKIESLCKEGCSQINALLDKADDGSELEELSDFDKGEISQIIDELSEIMSVYTNDDTSL
ncbi:MAG: hypothetical protein GQ572_08945 [Gammaproteobacteria bacterium]|nr:hypothetical protein [Gammaproteobacteria bacterium]